MLRVGINCRTLLGRYNSGIGKYITALARELNSMEGIDTVLYSERKVDDLPVRKISVSGGPRGVWFDRKAISSLAKGDGVDVLHVPKYVIPSRKPCPVVATIHDMYLFREPSSFPAATRMYWNRELPRTIENSDAIVVPSKFTESEILDLFPSAEGKITVAHHGVDPSYFRGNGERFREKYGPYILCVSSIHPRKNIDLLLDAMELYSGRERLVLVGHYGWMARKTADRISRMDKVIWLPTIDEKDMPDIMAGASAFAYPSMYEGFGMPVLEALAAGLNVVAMDIPVMREITSGHAYLASDSASFASALEKAVGSRNPAGREWASEFTWERSARTHLKAYESALRQ